MKQTTLVKIIVEQLVEIQLPLSYFGAGDVTSERLLGVLADDPKYQEFRKKLAALTAEHFDIKEVMVP